MKLLLYCTKAKKQKDLLWSNNLKHFFLDGAYNRLIDDLPEYLLNGKIVAECDYEIEEIEYEEMFVDIFDENEEIIGADIDKEYYTKTLYSIDLQDKSCLPFGELDNYLKGKSGYAIHIKNLHIFDKPIEIGEFYAYSNKLDDVIPVARLSSNRLICTDWQDIGGIPVCRGTFGHSLVLEPEELCRVLNKKQTAIVRKKVSKGMLLP